MNLGQRLLVYLSPRGGLVLLAGWRSLDWLAEIPSTEEGLQRFSSLLAQHGRLPVTLIVDSVDEDYRLETLPHVLGRARQELLTRKLRQIFRNAPYSAAIQQGRDSEGRRDDRYLMVSLTDSEWLHPWVAEIRKHNVPFAGMTLMSLAAENVLKRLRVSAPHVLLASRQSAGFRLSYFQQGRLRFSRLTRTDNAGNSNLNIADEVSKTQLYLSSQRIFPREARLTVVLLDLSNTLLSAQASLSADPQFETRLLNADEIGRRLGIPAALMANAPEVVYLAAMEPRFQNLAPAALSKTFRLHQIRWGLFAAGSAALVSGAAIAGWNWLQVRADTAQMQQIEASIRQNEALYRETLKQLPNVPLSAESLSRLVETAGRIEAANHTPRRAYEVLSSVLDRHPDILLDKLSWDSSDWNTGSKKPAESLVLDARIWPFNGNYRDAMDKISRFMRDLRAQPGAGEIELRSEPVNTASNTTLSGTTLQSAQMAEARFSLGFMLQRNLP